MDIYNYDPNTGIYLPKIDGPDRADESPLEPGNYLIPAYALIIAPPELADHESAIVNESRDGWNVVADYIGTEYWLSDGSKHKITGIGITPPANALYSEPPTPLSDLVKAALKSIDGDVDAIYSAVIGNRASEYERAESDALAYQAAGYTISPVPPYVQDWANAKSASPSWAADNIIETAMQWRTAQSSVRTNRLTAKEAARSAIDKAAIDAALAIWATFVDTIKESLNI